MGGKLLKQNVSIALTLILSLSFSTLGSAQKKRTSRRPAAEPASKPVVVDMHMEAQQVADQIKNVTKFLFIYGKIVNGLEIAEEQVKRGETSPTLAARNKQTKDALVTNITNLRAGIDNLSRNLQANPRLQVQYLKVSYAAEAVASAEQLARAGRYDDAGKTLATVVDRLTDAVMAMKLL
jgi:hypothetical protein